MEKIVIEIGNKLSAKKWQISAAESCTGGLICKLITDVAGSSQWFDRGFISYSNDAKVCMLNVAEETLVANGAVSLRAVEAMAAGALVNSRAHISLAVSGIAGPNGGTIEKPVGTVCFAWAERLGKNYSEMKIFKGDRDSIRTQTAKYALEGVLHHFL